MYLSCKAYEHFSVFVSVFRLCHQLWKLRHARQLGEQLAPSAFRPHRCRKHTFLHQSVLLFQVRSCGGVISVRKTVPAEAFDEVTLQRVEHVARI